jgi:hypothetical protein
MDPADPKPLGYAVHWHQDSRWHQSPRAESRDDRAARAGDRDRADARARHAQRVRRAGGPGLLHRHRAQSPGHRAIRIDHAGRAGCRADGDRRRERHTHGGGPRTVPGERAVRTGFPRRPAGARPGARPDAIRGPGAARAARRDPHAHRTGDDSRRRRATGRVRLRGHEHVGHWTGRGSTSSRCVPAPGSRCCSRS